MLSNQRIGYFPLINKNLSSSVREIYQASVDKNNMFTVLEINIITCF
jgi:hypothetical protein